jgi:UDP-N-acetylmuramoyl-L-alanyl-D-glutamate--2,6-diaminopimelate ligase
MNDLLHDVDVVGLRGDPATEVESVEFDSRSVRGGSLFCCLPGEHTDGHLHAADAVARGAVALVCERELDLPVTEVLVRSGTVRPAMAEIAAAFHRHPARDLVTVGVTGTNGKTTVTHLVRAVLDHAGVPTGVIGTLDGARTTPESPILQAALAAFRDDGTRAVALEVSSHALTQHRVDAMTFDVAAFTNLSREHLDHHGTMEEYYRAKARLFEPGRTDVAVVDTDDLWGRRLAEELEGTKVLAVGRAEATELEFSLSSTSFCWRGRRVRIPLLGAFNVDNALVAAGVAVALAVDEDTVAEGLGTVAPVPGRMELVGADAPFAVVVDYAHTPAGLETALRAARALTGEGSEEGKVICVFGCGGDRDAGKRPLMGAVASRDADLVVVTSDNPRTEDPAAIVDAVLAGMDGPAQVTVEMDRADAIRRAVAVAEPGDVVLLAGKGHETTQTVGEQTRPFDDRIEAARALRDRFGGAPT